MFGVINKVEKSLFFQPVTRIIQLLVYEEIIRSYKKRFDCSFDFNREAALQLQENFGTYS